MISWESYGIRIDDKPFVLEGIVTDTYVDVGYRHQFVGATAIGPLDGTAVMIAEAFGLADQATYRKKLLLAIDARCTGPLEKAGPLLKERPALVTGLGINNANGIYRFAFCCDIADKKLKPFNIPLAAYGFSFRYIPGSQ